MDTMVNEIWTAGLDPLWWIILGVALLVLEVFTSGFVLLWIGAGALLSGVLFWIIPLSLTHQGIAAAVISIIALVGGRPLLLRHLSQSKPDTLHLNERGAALIGTTAVLTTPLVNGSGRARVADGEWSVRCGADLPKGTPVRIEAVDGILLTVEPLTSRPSKVDEQSKS